MVGVRYGTVCVCMRHQSKVTDRNIDKNITEENVNHKTAAATHSWLDRSIDLWICIQRDHKDQRP